MSLRGDFLGLARGGDMVGAVGAGGGIGAGGGVGGGVEIGEEAGEGCWCGWGVWDEFGGKIWGDGWGGAENWAGEVDIGSGVGWRLGVGVEETVRAGLLSTADGEVTLGWADDGARREDTAGWVGGVELGEGVGLWPDDVSEEELNAVPRAGTTPVIPNFLASLRVGGGVIVGVEVG